MAKTRWLILIIFLLLLWPSHRLSQMQAQQKNPEAGKPADLPQFVAQIGHSRIGRINDAVFSADGRLIITAGSDQTAILWDVASARELRRFKQTSSVVAVALSADSRWLLTGDLTCAHLWDAATGKEIRRLETQMPVGALAFSPDGRLILTSSGSQQNLWNAATGELLRQFNAGTSVKSVSFSSDSRFILTGNNSGTATLWNTASGEAVRHFKHVEGKANQVQASLSPDGRFVLTALTGYEPNPQEASLVVRLWDTITGENIRTFKPALPVRSAEFSPDGRFVLTANDAPAGKPEVSLHIWDLDTATEIRSFKLAQAISIYFAKFSPDGKAIMISTYNMGGVALLDSVTGQEIKWLSGDHANIRSVAISPDNRSFLTAAGFEKANGLADFVCYLWDAQGEPVRVFEKSIGGAAAFSDDGRSILMRSGNIVTLYNADAIEVKQRFTSKDFVMYTTFSGDGRSVFADSNAQVAYLWDAASGKEIWRVQYGTGLSLKSVADVSPDGSLLVTAAPDHSAILWEGATGKVVRKFTTPYMVSAVVFSPDGRLAVTCSVDGARLWEVQSGKEVGRLKGDYHRVGDIDQVQFSADGRVILSRKFDNVSLWEAKTGEPLQQFTDPAGIMHAAYSRDGRFVLTGGWNFTTRLWNAQTGAELCRMFTLRNGAWVVVDQEGRFDTNDFNGLEEARALHWVMPDEPMKPLPLEIFQRDYYEPRLLARILAGESLRPVRSLSGLNRLQPQVKIAKIERQNGANTVSVTVEVAKAKAESKRGNQRVDETGVFDLRLFRDGQLIGYAPATGGEVLLDAATGKAVIRFDNIRLPKKTSAKEVEFSAYAFNVDRVKSATDRKPFAIPENLPMAKGRVYLVTIGVNAFENPDWNLSFAVNDARQTEKVLAENLAKVGDYEEIVPIPLLADYRATGGKLVKNRATKANIKAVFDRLAGKPPAPSAIPNLNKLQRAAPQDLIVISFSTHGYADATGNFYLFPYDIGTGWGRRITAQTLKRFISSDELSLWLRDVDAGEIVMVVDACYSAAAIESKDFKPGPMGSRGLGQLAYDKGMRILASTQSDDVALESANLKQGLLSYALIRDGIEARQADNRPKDGAITLAEWLKYGVERVPTLFAEVKKGEVHRFGRGPVVTVHKPNASLEKERRFQQPALFDFGNKQRQVVLVKD